MINHSTLPLVVALAIFALVGLLVLVGDRLGGSQQPARVKQHGIEDTDEGEYGAAA